MHHIGFRLTENTDPEERLEEAALWKALKDRYGDRISAVREGEDGGDDWVMFGRVPRFDTGREPVASNLRYWEDLSFLAHCERSFEIVDWEGLRPAVARLHAQGKGAFVKSTRMKHFVCRIPLGVNTDREMGAMAFSFMDGGPQLMVQSLVDMRFECRFFVIGREIITCSTVMHSLTPMDHTRERGYLYERPDGGARIRNVSLLGEYHMLVRAVAQKMLPEHAVIDVALIDGKPGVIEMNPMQLGQVGLYACDVYALAEAADKLMEGFVPKKRPAFVVRADEEEEFDDGALAP